MKSLPTLILTCLLSLQIFAQPRSYSTANAHSHNDYAQLKPFSAAYSKKFGSIEADVFSVANSDRLIVGHELEEIQRNPRTLDSLYLVPINNALKANHGHPYGDKSHDLQLMIDLKTEAIETLSKLVKTLNRYPAIRSSKQVHIVISGNTPAGSQFQI